MKLINILVLFLVLGLISCNTKNITNKIPTVRELRHKHFVITNNKFGEIVLGEDCIRDVIDKMGKGGCYDCGVHSPSKICYYDAKDENIDYTALIFEAQYECGCEEKKVSRVYWGRKSVIDNCFDGCERTKKEYVEIETKSGIKLGMTKSSFINIVGKPQESGNDTIKYFYEYKDKLTDELYSAQKALYERSGWDVSEIEPFYYINERIIAKFENNKLKMIKLERGVDF